MTTFPDRRQALAALCAALLVASAAWADDVQDASRLLKAGQHQQAMERVNKALAAKPRDAQARFLKGLIFAEQGNARDATEMFLQLTKDFPDLPEPYNNLAVIYASQGQYDKARAALEQSIRTHPSYATAYENLGDVYAKLASQAYDKALQIDSANSVAKNKLAMVRELVGGSLPAKPAAVAVAAAPAAAQAGAGAIAPAAAPAAAPKEATKAPPVVTAAAAATEAKPAAAKPAANGGNVEVLDTVTAWARAWSSKNVDAYLAFYSKDFRTPGGESRAEWEKVRRARIVGPKSISVTVESPKVTVAAEGQASVTFRQGYRSDVIRSTTTKTLVLARQNGRWQIQQERVGN